MPVSYVCSETDATITWATADPVTLRDWEHALERAGADDLVQRLRPARVIVDLRNRSAFNSGAVIRNLVSSIRDRLTERGRHGIRAAFLVSDALGHGVVRVASAYTDDVFEIQIFREPGDAERWLYAPAESRNDPRGRPCTDGRLRSEGARPAESLPAELIAPALE